MNTKRVTTQIRPVIAAICGDGRGEMKETPPLMANADRFSLPLSSVPHIDEIGRGRTSPCPRLELAAATKDQDGMGDEIWEPASCTMVMPR